LVGDFNLTIFVPNNKQTQIIMKRLFFILLLVGSPLALMTTSCEKDECTQEALCSSTSSAFKTSSARSSTDWSKYSCGEDKYYVCHNGKTLCIGSVEAV
jgi:hypothetical protein